jgi:7,8-dihydropterin-6-yl-methyl-4-(beta-D-ribofuranosyl)aminobenzene 5'-phosphate synthase
MITKVVTALKDRFKPEYIAPGHCTGEPTFAALKKAPVGGDLAIYHKFAAREDPFGIIRSRGLRQAANP